MTFIVLFKDPGSWKWNSTKPMCKEDAQNVESSLLGRGKVTTLMEYSKYITQGYRQHQRGSVELRFEPVN